MVENAANVLEQLINHLDTVIPEILENEGGVRRVPPASKEVVAKLPVITLTEEILAKLGSDAECAICKENLAVGDNMQELPCKHTFHPPCLKPWLDEHNSCPICRHELQTDDHDYESWKEREKEAEEERKGAANAVRGGEYMMHKRLDSCLIVPPSGNKKPRAIIKFLGGAFLGAVLEVTYRVLSLLVRYQFGSSIFDWI
ncbi:hypothetical protein V6N12_052224 [Hibiscus sabdariffa]|uniref:RING-type E3 ubiquitin transferase n=1 Tax=Hibiscus sabdariffa TaxID=183260 RepID=A0ABR2GIU5_9ROSI